VSDTQARRTRIGQVGFLGGSPEKRLERRKRPDIEHVLFLNPVAVAADVEALRRFQAPGRLAVEVGFGKGRFLFGFAHLHHDWRILGFEVRRKLCLATLERLECGGLDNGRVLLGDARALLPRHIGPGRISALFVLFPDPWWKKKHHRRRLLDASFLRLLEPLLSRGALLVVRSDVPLVMELAAQAVAEVGFFTAIEGAGMELPETGREVVCRSVGIPVHEQCYRFEPAGSFGHNTSET
jgi:tRNA (guanine-N7-)-methyltransferase